MDESYPTLCVVLAVTSDTAFLELGGVTSLARAFDFLRAGFPSKAIVVVVSPELASKVATLLDEKGVNYELAVCRPSDPISLTEALEGFVKGAQSVLIHDACRPLVSQEQFEQVIKAFDSEVDAIRPALPFTETLKILDKNSVIKETLDRSSVLRISTPELIRITAIDKDASDSGWFLPLKKEARIVHTEGSPDGTRINTSADRDLMELHQD